MRLTFHQVSVLKYHAVRARIRAQADETRCTGNAGTATSNGVVIEWEYIEAEAQLSFTCDQHPWWITEGMVQSRIRGLMEGLK